MANMTTFDAPSREVCVLKRSRPEPAAGFVLLNDPQFVEAARVLAQEMLTDAGPQETQQVAFAFRRLTARNPEPRETKLLVELFDEAKKLFHEEPDRATKLVAIGDKNLIRSSMPAILPPRRKSRRQF